MEFSEPSEAVQIGKALDDSVEQEVEPLECEHPEFLGEDQSATSSTRATTGSPRRDVVEQIRQKSLEAVHRRDRLSAVFGRRPVTGTARGTAC